MNGAESLVHSLLRSGVTTCFSNPGTSEMHFVAALDRVPGMHCVLGLFEGVVTGAADGYARMAGKPAAVRAWPTAWPICTMLAAPARRHAGRQHRR
jgi:acetolactate synthase I/II/III large subunit